MDEVRARGSGVSRSAILTYDGVVWRCRARSTHHARQSGYEMSDLLIQTRNTLDRKTYSASVVPKHEVVEYWSATAGRSKPQRVRISVKATATSRKSIFARSNPPRLVVCYGIGRLEFDAFYDLVLAVLSTCDMRAFKGLPNSMTLRDLCARHGVIPDQGEVQLEGRSIPFLMLFDHDSVERGY
jgi:hypothetical protein